MTVVEVGAARDGIACMDLAIAVVAIVLTLLAGSVLFAALGTSPLQGLNVFVVAPLASLRGWSSWRLKRHR